MTVNLLCTRATLLMERRDELPEERASTSMSVFGEALIEAMHVGHDGEGGGCDDPGYQWATGERGADRASQQPDESAPAAGRGAPKARRALRSTVSAAVLAVALAHPTCWRRWA